MAPRRAHSSPWGTEIVDGGARFRLWAPAQAKVSLLTESGATIPMHEAGDGWFEITTDAVRPGDGYHFVLARRYARARPRVARATGRRARYEPARRPAKL